MHSLYKRLAFLVVALAATLGAIAYAQVPGVNTTLNTIFTLTYDSGILKPTFSATASVSPASTGTDILELRGSSTKVVRLRRVRVNGVATAAMNLPITLVRRTALDTAGTVVNVNIASYDSAAYNTETATVFLYTANPTETATAAVTNLITETYVPIGNYTTGLITGELNTVFGQSGASVVLRAATEAIAVNLNGFTPSGAILTVTVEWTEE